MKKTITENSEQCRDPHGRGSDACPPSADMVLDAPTPFEAELSHIARLKILGELTASIVHEVNQPLAAIATHGEACLRWLGYDEPRLEEARASVAAMIRNALRSTDVIRRLRALSMRGESQKAAVCLNAVIESVVPLLKAELARNSVLLQLDLAPDLPPVLGDCIQLQQVIVNLLINGIQAMDADCDRPRELLVRSQPHAGDHVLVVVQDNGRGIATHHVDKLFNAFFTTKNDGMGMGLAICRSIVEVHDGRIWASCNCDHGASFHISLPAFADGLVAQGA